MKGVTITTSRQAVAPATPEQWESGEIVSLTHAVGQKGPAPTRGQLIAIEGIDGSGKSTLAAKLADKLGCSRAGHPPLLTREPYDPTPDTRGLTGIGSAPIGRIRRALQADSKVDPFQLAIMFAADRFAHLEDQVLPALRQGRDVVCDRYTLSTIAYQSIKLPEEFVFQLVQAAPPPDLTILLDMDPEVSMKRLLARGIPLESYEKSIDTQIELRDRYLDYVTRSAYLGEKGRVLIIPADRTAELDPAALADYVFARVLRLAAFDPLPPPLTDRRDVRAKLIAQWAISVSDTLELVDAIEAAQRRPAAS